MNFLSTGVLDLGRERIATAGTALNILTDKEVKRRGRRSHSYIRQLETFSTAPS